MKKQPDWSKKMNPLHLPKVVDVPDKWAAKIGHGRMAIVTPSMVDTFVKQIPKGTVVTMNQLREHFAYEMDADTTCPLTTGIFVSIVAKHAEHQRALGEKNITPYWRVLKEGGKLNPKFPGGVIQHAALLEAEGLRIVKGKSQSSWRVKDHEQHTMLLEA